MALFGKATPRRIVVKEYGRDFIFIAALNPFMTALLVSMVGMEGLLERRLESQARAMERDAVEMAKRGYRVVSSHEYEAPRFGIAYQKVTYELVDPAEDGDSKKTSA
jgi:hypothetical protein